MSYMVDAPPPEDKIMQRNLRAWEPQKHIPNMTASKSAFKTYSTYVYMAQTCVIDVAIDRKQDQEQVGNLATGGYPAVMRSTAAVW